MGEMHPLTYRAKYGKEEMTFRFELRETPGCWRIYIRQQPGYRRRSTTAHATHRLSDNGNHYICWQGRIQTKDEAEAVAKLWADKTAAYIVMGHRF